jgi:hypothetical protein
MPWCVGFKALVCNKFVLRAVSMLCNRVGWQTFFDFCCFLVVGLAAGGWPPCPPHQSWIPHLQQKLSPATANLLEEQQQQLMHKQLSGEQKYGRL